MSSLPFHLYQKLEQIGQQHLLAYWNNLSERDKQLLTHQIETLDLTLFSKQRALLTHPEPHFQKTYTPFKAYAQVSNQTAKNLHEMGCILVAGGQGSRLRINGPKGLVPISVVKKKTLFQLFAEKAVAASRQVGVDLALAIMTSPANDALSRSYFAENHRFGLKETQLSFFVQTHELPFLDEKGDLFLEEQGRIAEGPDGNGLALIYFYESGLWQQWWERGIRYANFILIDNPLADPFDAALLHQHVQQQNEVTVKCVAKATPEEKVGVLVNWQEQTHIVEYTELSAAEKAARLPTGQLKHHCANLSLYCFDMLFIKRLAEQHRQELPLHLAHKAVKTLDASGHPHTPSSPNAWKFEYFIFDVLPFAKKVGALLYPRETCFAPLKNFSGEASITTVQKALQDYDAFVFQKISGQRPPLGPFELSQEFHYPTPSLLKHWKGKEVNGPYLDGM